MRMAIYTDGSKIRVVPMENGVSEVTFIRPKEGTEKVCLCETVEFCEHERKCLKETKQ